jgi:hypothetical protein
MNAEQKIATEALLDILIDAYGFMDTKNSTMAALKAAYIEFVRSGAAEVLRSRFQ